MLFSGLLEINARANISHGSVITSASHRLAVNITRCVPRSIGEVGYSTALTDVAMVISVWTFKVEGFLLASGGSRIFKGGRLTERRWTNGRSHSGRTRPWPCWWLQPPVWKGEAATPSAQPKSATAIRCYRSEGVLPQIEFAASPRLFVCDISHTLCCRQSQLYDVRRTKCKRHRIDRPR